ncbi:hypothetical protein AJ88_23290 [Mesorhizobium amorphae CCBAU 01583]|nr:hypothetical protein AJ88_23290 [Mesorhizobium amorphae CCBAU 01583]
MHYPRGTACGECTARRIAANDGTFQWPVGDNVRAPVWQPIAAGLPANCCVGTSRSFAGSSQRKFNIMVSSLSAAGATVRKHP